MALAVIDPGHGGTAPVGNPPSSPNNATGPQGTKEKNLVLDIGLKCRDILRRQGISVLMTRDSDVNVGLYDRAHVARDNRADAFVSIHLNGNTNPSIQGTETWVYNGTGTTSDSYRHHAHGRAVDIGNEDIADHLLHVKGIATDSKVQSLEIDEIIFDAGGNTLQLRNRWNYDQGQRHDYDATTLAAHGNHIHFAVKN